MRAVIKAKFVLKDTDHLLRKFHMEAGGQMQASIDTAFLRYSEMYMPYDSGSLIARSYADGDRQRQSRLPGTVGALSLSRRNLRTE